jgi:tetratricopeptide (TPR) repeat protein
VRLWLGDAAGALRDLDEAAKGGARYAFAWRGAAKIAAGRAKDALPDLDRALALKPWDLEALVWRGEVRRRLGRRAQALEDLNAAVELTQNAWPLCHRALVHADAGDDAALLADFEEISSSTGAVFVPPLLARLRLKPSPVSPALARKVLRAMAALNHADCRSYELAFKYR